MTGSANRPRRQARPSSRRCRRSKPARWRWRPECRPGQAALAAGLGATAFEVPGAGPATTACSGRFDLVIEAAGTAAAVDPTIALARCGGRVILLARPATA